MRHANTMSTPKGQLSRIAILDAAIGILVDEGYAAISMDKVAKKLDISKGNITYHFPNKKALVQAVFQRLLRQSRELRQEDAGSDAISPKERLKQKVTREFEILMAPMSDARLWETLAYSLRDETVQHVFEEVFDWYIQNFIETLRPLRPDLDVAELGDLAIFILSITRGMLVFIGTANTDEKRRIELRDKVVAQILPIVEKWQPADAGEATFG